MDEGLMLVDAAPTLEVGRPTKPPPTDDCVLGVPEKTCAREAEVDRGEQLGLPHAHLPPRGVELVAPAMRGDVEDVHEPWLEAEEGLGVRVSSRHT